MTRSLSLLLVIVPFSSADAYIGPGLGLGVIATTLGILAAIILAVVSTIYYPIKRYFKKRSLTKENTDDSADSDHS